ncbi:MAG: hypothetical protein RIC55_28700 [Pirellulaceae bacterium]
MAPTATRTQDWDVLIDEAVSESDPLRSNFKITRAHFLLATALREAIGPQAGANFHNWAVWGSRKAGVTIRQEDKDQASRDATVVAGLVGCLVGIGVGVLLAWLFTWPAALSILVWVLIGVATGGYCGYRLAGYTRRAASRLILEGNRLVLDDIGRVTGRYLQYVECARAMDADERRRKLFQAFLDEFRPGPTEQGGQDRLRQAFEQYEQARGAADLKTQHQCNYFANCLAVLHEHIRLQPYISRSMPLLIRKCVTQRLMTYSVGRTQLAVHEDVPPLADDAFPATLCDITSEPLRDFLEGSEGWDVSRGTLRDTRTCDWTDIRQRMGYVVNLFRTRHTEQDVVASPYSPEQLEAIASGRLPARPW